MEPSNTEIKRIILTSLNHDLKEQLDKSIDEPVSQKTSAILSFIQVMEMIKTECKCPNCGHKIEI